MTPPTPTPNPNVATGINPPPWRIRAGAKPFILHPDGRRQTATTTEVHHYVQTGELPKGETTPGQPANDWREIASSNSRGVLIFTEAEKQLINQRKNQAEAELARLHHENP